MLDGRYPSERFAELRPRIVWDRTGGTMRGRPGARQLAIANAGTIPDRGLYGVHLPDGRRVGELDEEMVYEARPGQTFLLGATTWRIEEITRDRVIVTPAPGVPGAVPFWRGDGIGRPAELGKAIGEFSREAVNADPKQLAKENDLDKLAAQNLVNYLTGAAGRDPGRPLRREHRRRALPRRDRRLAPLRPLALRRPRARRLGPGAVGQDPRRARARGRRDLVRRRHRHPPARRRRAALGRPGDARAGRARGPGRPRALGLGPVRRPLPRERLALAADPARLARQAHPAVAAAAEVAEPARGRPRLPPLPGHPRDLPRGACATSSTCPRSSSCCGDLHSRKITMVEVETPTASPFASSLLFDYVATYMYEGDTPNAERRAAALALDRDLLRELLGQEELRELIDPEALEEVEDSLQQRTEAGLAKDRDGLQQVLRRLGDLTAEEAEQRVVEGYSAESMLEKLVNERRAALVRVNGEERYIAAEDAGLYRDALGVPPPAGLPESFLEPVEDAMRLAGPPLRRAATAPSRPRSSPTATASTRRPALRELEAAGRPGPRRAAARRHRARVVRRRRAAPDPPRQPRPPAQGGRGRPTAASSPASCRAGRTSTSTAPPGAGPDRLREALIPLQGVALTPKTWERDVLPRRLGAYSPAWLDELCTSGELVWIGAGAAGPQRRPGRPLLPRGRAPRRAAARQREARARPRARSTTRSASASPQGPCFWLDLLDLDGDRRGAARGALGPRLVGRGHQRRLRAAARAAPARRAAPRARRAAASPSAARPPSGTVLGPLVADRAAVRGRAARRAAAAGAGRADAGAPRHRHPRDGDRRGHPRRLRHDLRRAPEPGAAGHRPPRLLRRGPGRRPVRAAGRGRAPAQPAARRRRAADPGRDRSGQPLRRDPALAEAGGPAPPGADRERLRGAARRRAAALRRARRPRHPAPAPSSRARSWPRRLASLADGRARRA